MGSIEERPLSDTLSFGARVRGVDRAALESTEARAQLADVYERRGVIVFEDIEQSAEMQLELSGVFGSLRQHAMNAVPKAGENPAKAVMELNCHPGEADVFEIGGERLAGFVSWHYDACYTKHLYRGGLLRALAMPPTGGMTGFADGIQLYGAISPNLRELFEHLGIVYEAKLMFMNQRFGLPQGYKVLSLQKAAVDVLKASEDWPRAVHPAVWQRPTGEKVLHVSPWQAAGIAGHEDADGDALLAELCDEITAKMTPYWHSWKPTDMVVWDNWRTIHSVSGHDPQYARRVHRATIEGDYGLGRFENELAEAAV